MEEEEGRGFHHSHNTRPLIHLHLDALKDPFTVARKKAETQKGGICPEKEREAL